MGCLLADAVTAHDGVGMGSEGPGAPVLKAIAVLTTGNGQVHGTVQFEQHINTTIHINITGLTPGMHGFHIHEKGDLTDGCVSCGPHYNPRNFTHASPNDTMRHVGDLGNIEADANGTVVLTLNDTLVQLSGPFSVLGRSVVVHALPDDLGKGVGDKKAESKKTGNAGARVACGLIGIQ